MFRQWREKAAGHVEPVVGNPQKHLPPVGRIGFAPDMARCDHSLHLVRDRRTGHTHLLPEIAREIGMTQLGERDRYTVYRPVPTEENPTGYRGRTTILELLMMSDPIRRLVMQHATSGEIQALAIAEGMRTMYLDGLGKCLQGITTLDEVLRVTQEA